MKKEEIVDIDNLLSDYESNLSDQLQVKLDSYIKELIEMNNDQLPHYGEKLMSSIFTMQERIADHEGKLVKYIKNETNKYRLNLFINETKRSESYLNVSLKIKKLLVFLYDYKKEISLSIEEYKLKLLALKKYLDDYNNLINKQDNVDSDIFNRIDNIKRQYEMMSNLFSMQYPHLKDLDKLSKEYSNLYNKYLIISRLYGADYNIIVPNISKKMKIINMILTNQDVLSCVIKLLFYKKELHRLNDNYPYKVDFSPLSNGLYTYDTSYYETINEVTDEVAYQMLYQTGIPSEIDGLGIGILYFCANLVNLDEYLETKYVVEINKEVLTETYNEVKSSYREINYNYDRRKSFDITFKALYLEYIIDLMKKNKPEFIYNNEFLTKDALKEIIEVLYRNDYNYIDFMAFVNYTSKYVEYLERNKDENLCSINMDAILNMYRYNYFNNSYPYDYDRYYSYSKRGDVEISDIDAKYFLLEGFFMAYANDSHIKYNDKKYLYSKNILNYLKYILLDKNRNEVRSLNLDFVLNDELLTSLFIINYVGYLIDFDEFTFERLDKEFFISLFDQVMSLIDSYLNGEINLDKDILFDKLYEIKEMKAALFLVSCYDHGRYREYSFNYDEAQEHYLEFLYRCHEKEPMFLKRTTEKDFNSQDLHQLIVDKFNEVVKKYDTKYWKQHDLKKKLQKKYSR